MPTPVPSPPAPAEAELRFRAMLDRAARTRAGSAARLGEALDGALPGALTERVVSQVAGQLESLAAEFESDCAAEIGRDPALLAHLQARAIEFALLERMADAQGTDPVLPLLLQAAVAAQADVGELLAAQARFVQDQRRGELSPAELPAAVCAAIGLAAADGLRGRAALLAGFVEASRTPNALLDPAQAGFSLFASALAARSGLARDEVVMASVEAGQPRLILALLAGGLPAAAVERCLLALSPDGAAIDPVPDLDAATAAALLAGVRS